MVKKDTQEREDNQTLRHRQKAIGNQLKQMFDAITQEPVPDDFLELLEKIEDTEAEPKPSQPKAP